MATKKQVAANAASNKNTVKKETAAPEGEKTAQENTEVKAEVVKIPKCVADKIDEQRNDIILLVCQVKALIGMCVEDNIKDKLDSNQSVCLEMAKGISHAMSNRYHISTMELMGATTFLAKDIAPMAVNALKKGKK